MNTDTDTTNTDTTKTDWQKRECGALWKKESPTQKFYSGHVKIDDNGKEKVVKVMVFANRHKSKDSHPDFRIYTVGNEDHQVSSSSTDNEVEEVL